MEIFIEAEKLIVGRNLFKAMTLLENHLLMNPRQGDYDALRALKNDYRLMTDYWRAGYEDPQREQLYSQLQRRLYELNANMAIAQRIRSSRYLTAMRQRPRQLRQDWSLTTIRHLLESHVQDVAMLSLEPEHTRQPKEERLYSDHQLLMADLFDYIWTSRLWKDTQADAFEEMLLSPTIDAVDQQLMVSAITIAAVNAFDFQKFHLLTNVYRKTTDASLRQRALVGWVFSADAKKRALYPEMSRIVATLCAEETVADELKELQMQLFFCMNAEDDRQTIQNDIMPELMKAGRLRITRQGIIEQEEDTLEDILHPDADEQNMERMEQSMRRMVDMQRQGSDIYFAGFSQMKRFSFFTDTSNWFVPFYPQHPGISHTWKQSQHQRFLHLIMKMGAFCDSDKYSFVLAFDQVLSRMPQSVLKLVEQGEATPMPIGGEIDPEEQRQPAFMRRLYLQNLYRFFRLYPQRNEFVSIFSEQPSIFFASPLFSSTNLESRMPDVASFLSKHRQYDAAMRVLRNISAQHQDAAYHLLLATLLMRQSAQDPEAARQAIASYEKALDAHPDNTRVLMGLARALFTVQDYKRALHTYEQLLLLVPDSRTAELNAAVCLTHLERYEEALKLLYKLNYLDATDDNVVRVMAWTLTVSGKYEQARRYYDHLTSLPVAQATDRLNQGYCLWLSGNIEGAVAAFKLFSAQQQDAQFSFEQEFMQQEHALLSNHHISDTEIRLMLDSIEETNT